MLAFWPLVWGWARRQSIRVTQIVEKKTARVHLAWAVAAVGFVTLIGAAGFRSVPGVLLDPLHDEFGWSHATISAAVSINLLLYGLISPFAAALMDRLGLRRVRVACRHRLLRARHRRRHPELHARHEVGRAVGR